MLASPAHLYMPYLFTHCLPTIIMCYVDVYCVIYLFLLYATFLCDSILDCLCTYFCLIVFFIPFLSFWLFTICQYPQCCVLNWMFLLWYTRYLVLKLVSSINVLVLLIDIICILHIMSEKEKSYLARYCCNLSGGVALIVWFTMNRMCAKNKNICMWRKQAIIEWSRRSDLGEWPVIMLVNLVNSWLCLLNGDDESDLVGWSLLLLAATVRSFAHMACARDFRSQHYHPTTSQCRLT